VNQVTYIGHATLLIELDGLRLLTDPLLTARVSHLSRTSTIPHLDLPHLDVVLLSHLHADHFHLPSLRRLGRDHLTIAPRGAAPFLARHGFRRVIEMKAGETVSIKGVDIEATRAHHPGRQMPGRPRTDCLGYVIHGQHNVYFTGDTDIFDGMADIGERVDVALLPVWGWGPTLGVGHMDPFRAARALKLLQPSLAIPIHWGTYFPWGMRSLLPDYVGQPPYEFARHANRLAPEVQVCVLDPGDALNLTRFYEKLGPPL
jgi:L-ascorbate metabolism protein UlaG (beta-lactamase superfamily)